MLVTICVITYQRPEGLKRLMKGLNHLTFSGPELPDLHVVVVDNDSTGSAYAFCEGLKPGFRWALTCSVELRRGISFARNRAIACVPPETNFIAFIDDDEIPEPSWLEKLLIVQAAYKADVVHGPVLPHFPEAVSNWITKGKFFEQRRYATGHLLEAAYTNNVLVRAEILKAREKPFDERFALTGGEDSYFFRNLYQAGYKLVWANEAIVHEWVPQSRTNLQWILQRGYRSCLTYTLWEKEAKPSIQTRVTSVTKALGQIVLGLLLVPPALILERHVLTTALLRICRGAGRLSGLAGVTYEEYKTVHKI